MNRSEINATLKRTNIRGKDYIDVAQRINGFWEIFPEGRITTEWPVLNDEWCVCQATVWSLDVVMAQGTAYEVKGASSINKTSYIENCETSAIGRALGIAGIGSTDSVASANEVSAAMSQQEAAGRYKKPIPSKETRKAKKGPQNGSQCQEYDDMLRALADYCEITGTDKGTAWLRWGATVKKDDAEMCLAVIADIERVLNE